jgi:prepilin-type N-terminal cleavage/methylation domain-containing protein
VTVRPARPADLAPPRSAAGAGGATGRGFTLLELLIALAIFAVIGTAVVTLLGQGMTVFTQGTADTSMHDRLGSLLPVVREDLAAIYVPEASGVPPPPKPAGSFAVAKPAAGPSEVPWVRLRSEWVTMSEQAKETAYPSFYVAWVRTDAREAEDPLKREAGTAPKSGGELKTFDPASQEAAVKGTAFLPTGGLMEVAYVAVAEDLSHPGVLTLYRAFRAPIGGEKTLLEPQNLDSLAKVRAAGRPVAHGVLDFRITFRNVFATSWDELQARGSIEDGRPYVGLVWDSTRARNKQFLLHRGPESLGDVFDDVFPARARIELTLAYPAPVREDAPVRSRPEGSEVDAPATSDWAQADLRLAAPLTPDENRVQFLDVGRLVGPGASERWLKVDGEWMSTTIEQVDIPGATATVKRRQRGTPAKAHPALAPVYLGASSATDVPLVWKDTYVRRGR